MNGGRSVTFLGTRYTDNDANALSVLRAEISPDHTEVFVSALSGYEQFVTLVRLQITSGIKWPLKATLEYTYESVIAAIMHPHVIRNNHNTVSLDILSKRM